MAGITFSNVPFYSVQLFFCSWYLGKLYKIISSFKKATRPVINLIVETLSNLCELQSRPLKFQKAIREGKT